MASPSDRIRAHLEQLAPGRFGELTSVARGGMGMVWRARDRREGDDAAIKHLPPLQAANPEMRHRFFQEVQILEQLEHAAFPRVRLSSHEPLPLFVMDFVAGTSWKDLAREQGPQPPARVGALLVAAARALGHAHGRGVIHRDVKPENLVVLPGGGVAVLDFGIAADLAATRITRSGFGVGTPAYMPPEQLQGEDPTPLNDVFALAASGCYLLTGRPPRREDHQGDALLPELPPGTARSLRETLRAGLATRPADRPPSMEAFAASLLEEAP